MANDPNLQVTGGFFRGQPISGFSWSMPRTGMAVGTMASSGNAWHGHDGCNIADFRQLMEHVEGLEGLERLDRLPPYDSGYLAGLQERPLSDNPWELHSTNHQRWTAGQVDGLSRILQATGRFDHGAGWYDDNLAPVDRAEWKGDADDPVVRILGGYDDLPAKMGPVIRHADGRVVPIEDPDAELTFGEAACNIFEEYARSWHDITVQLSADVEPFIDQIKDLAAATGAALGQVGQTYHSLIGGMLARSDREEALARIAKGLDVPMSMLTGIPDEPPHRRREKQLIDQRRRSHRRTNRWGAPPGRR